MIKVWQPTYIHPTAKIGKGTRIGKFCDIGKNVKIGKNCNIQASVTISNETVIGDDVFIGPNVSILNDKYMDGKITPAKILDGAKIGGGTVILPDVTVGRGCVIGADSLVTKDVENGVLSYGHPSKKRGSGRERR